MDDTAGLDTTLSSPVRLRIAAYLAGCDTADFAAVQAYCQMSASNLSKQVTTLTSVGYVEVRKVASGRYPKTTLALTPEGRDALTAHVARLRHIAEEGVANGERHLTKP